MRQLRREFVRRVHCFPKVRNWSLLFWLCPVLFTTDPVAAQQDVSKPVGPGAVHRFVYRPEGPWAINVLTVDVSNPYIDIETIKARDRLAALERTSSMAARNDREGHRVVGAVNADFFAADGTPTGLAVSRGVLVHRPSYRTFFGIDARGRPLLARVDLQGEALLADGPVIINGVNSSRGTDQLILYNSYMGLATGTNQYGTEVSLRPIEPVFANRSSRFVAAGIDSISGNQALNDSTWVLSGHGVARDALARRVRIGDTLEIALRLPPLIDAVKEAVGGLPRIVRDGAVSVETSIDGGSNFATVRHPRTAVGFSADSTSLWLVTVDGRQPNYSEGMTLYELADLLIELGVYQGVNLDGGGSTAMVVRGEVVNRPSDGQGERSVSNAVLVISRAPTDTLAHLNLLPHRVELFSGRTLRFAVSGLDRFYNPLDLSQTTLEWYSEPRIGTVTAEGVLTAAAEHDSGYVVVRAGQVADSALVVVHVLSRVVVQPEVVVLDPGDQQRLTAYGVDTGRRRVEFGVGETTWSTTGGVGEVTADGLFTAVDSGRGWVEARADEIVGRAEVLVGIGGEVLLDTFVDLLNWRLDGVDVHLLQSAFGLTSETFRSPPTAARLDYVFTRSGGTSVFYLENGVSISGAPDSLAIFLEGDNRACLVTAEFSDRDEELFELTFLPATEPLRNAWTRAAASLKDVRANWQNLGARLDPPIRLRRFLVYPAGGSVNERVEGTIWLDDLSATYLSGAETGVPVPAAASQPREVLLFPNFPNPFNQSTEFEYSVPSALEVNLSIFDLRGKLVKQLVSDLLPAGTHRSEWSGDDARGRSVSSGLYFCRLSAGEERRVRRVVLLR